MNIISLNGVWRMDWISDQPYAGEIEPQIHPQSDSALCCSVPGYWEDMADLFRTTAMHTKLKYNPLYTLQRYPQAGYVPDMALPNPVGCFVYQRSVMLESIVEGEVELFIGGAQNTVSAWINGQYLGRHEGYSTSFVFIVDGELIKEGKNQITLAVSNTRLAGYQGKPVSGVTSRAACECTGGIWGDVELRIYPDGLRNVWVSTSRDCSEFTVHTEGAIDYLKTVKIKDNERCICTVEIPAGEESCIIDTVGFTFWSPDNPKLYIVEVSSKNQTVSARFGIRRLITEGTRLYLNGKPWYFRSVCECAYQYKTVHPSRDQKVYRVIIRKLKELGFNAIRFHTWVPPQEYMKAADEMGMVLEVESPNNTSYEEWKEIVRFCHTHASVCIYCTGNELQIDHAYEEHLKLCAELIHSESDSLFSPLSAMRGIEYCIIDDEYIEEPFRYNPRRLADVGQFCDVYNSYSLGYTSYFSASGSADAIDKRNTVYGKPLLSHEIGIHGTYIDLALEERYRGTRIGETEFMSSVRRHLETIGLLDKANLYYRNSAAWQRTMRKHCFETVRRCKTFAGYDFLGDIDVHWHTFGYCVGMMNEFYELKPGETVENVRRYNSDTVLLADIPCGVNYSEGTKLEIPVLVSHYGSTIEKALLQIRISNGNTVLYRRELRIADIACGDITELYKVSFLMPKCEKPAKLTLTVVLSGGDTDCENCWNLYVFPKPKVVSSKKLQDAQTEVIYDCDGESLWKKLQAGKNVVLFGTGPFAWADVSWQISLAGRTDGHLATVIADHPVLEDFPHDGYCDRQFENMMNQSRAVLLDLQGIPHEPLIDIASSYKNAHREALIAEYRVGKGKLFICPLHFPYDDPAAAWLKNKILAYVTGNEFLPDQCLTDEQFFLLCKMSPVIYEKNANEAMNKNDITM